MATIAGAFTALANFAGNVSGIRASFDLSAVPEQVAREYLPCALIIPQNGQEVGFSTLAYFGNAPKMGFSVKQLILYAPSQSTRFQDVVPGLVALLDTYLSALKAKPFLVDMSAPGTAAPIAQPAQFKPTMGVVEYAGTTYHAIELNFSLEIYP